MTRLEIEWPDDTMERVRAARGRLELAGAVLRDLSFEERLRSIERVLEGWTAPDSAWRREWAEALAESSSCHEDTLREGIDAALLAWRPDRFVACARRELAGALESETTSLVPFDWTAILAGGGVPMPTLLNALLPLVLGSPVLMREASNDRVTATCLRRSLGEVDDRLARAFEAIALSSEDLAVDTLLEAPCVVATGSDETIRAIAARLRPSQRFVAYAHRFSIGLLGGGLETEGLEAAAVGFARDVARWDQLGCLSPVVVYLVALDWSAATRIARAFARALEDVSRSLPRGPLSTAVAAQHANERAEARMREAAGEALLLEGDDFTVVLEASAQPRPAPLHRFLRLMPVASIDALEGALRAFDGRLSNVARAGFSAEESRMLRERLARSGISRWTRPGRMQTPPIDWPHDGMPLFTPLARFDQLD